MDTIIVRKKDGSEVVFPPPQNFGDCFNVIEYDGAFAIITDIRGDKHSIPVCDIVEIITKKPENKS